MMTIVTVIVFGEGGTGTTCSSGALVLETVDKTPYMGKTKMPKEVAFCTTHPGYAMDGEKRTDEGSVAHTKVFYLHMGEDAAET